MRDCTRLEVEYLPSTLELLFGSPSLRRLLSEDEIEKLESLQKIAVEDRRAIMALSDKLAEAAYTDTSRGIPGVPAVAEVTCYRNGKRIASFTLRRDFVVDGDGHWFDYRSTDLDFFRFTPDVWPYVVRVRCAGHMWGLSRELHRLGDDRGEYPSAETWCDTVMGAYLRRTHPPLEDFLCPGADEGACHFAMNAACTRESAPDCVLLFEAEPGWNQHGGPELFSFEHHEPRGGHVLLKDRRIKFIRTKEELNQLRWE